MDIQLLESLKMLSVAERIQLVEDLWDSIAVTQEEFGLSEAQQIEFECRLDALEQKQSPLSSWSEVKARILDSR
ncbi:MAG: addiction module protein [Candidatus Competibacteraceae bacterium]